VDVPKLLIRRFRTKYSFISAEGKDNNTINVEVNLLEASKILKVTIELQNASIHNFASS
jgi:hypothetical protein